MTLDNIDFAAFDRAYSEVYQRATVPSRPAENSVAEQVRSAGRKAIRGPQKTAGGRKPTEGSE